MVNSMIDITSAISLANLTLNGINQNKKFLESVAPITAHGSVGTEAIIRTKKYLNKDGDIKEIDERNMRFITALKINCGYWLYHDIYGALNYVFLLNPANLGSNGLSIVIPENNTQRYLFNTGRLSGCSAALLMKKRQIVFVHTGASSDSQENKSTVEERNTLLFKMIFELEGLDFESEVRSGSSSDESICRYLQSLEYEGIICHYGNERILNCNKITLAGYQNNFGFLCGAINEDGTVSVSLSKYGNAGLSYVARLYDI